MLLKTLATAFCLSLTLAVASAGAEAKDYAAQGLKINNPWTRATPAGAVVGAGYVKIENTGKEADRLVGGSLTGAGSVQIHEMSIAGGVMKMRELANGLEIKPGATVELKPGSYHVMFMDLKQPIKEGTPIDGTLVFEHAGKVAVQFDVRPIGSGPAGHH